MKTLYLKEKNSGNFEISPTPTIIKFDDEVTFTEWFKRNCNGYTKYRSSYGRRIIKATYRMSQTYFYSASEVLTYHFNHLTK